MEHLPTHPASPGESTLVNVFLCTLALLAIMILIDLLMPLRFKSMRESDASPGLWILTMVILPGPICFLLGDFKGSEIEFSGNGRAWRAHHDGLQVDIPSVQAKLTNCWRRALSDAGKVASQPHA